MHPELLAKLQELKEQNKSGALATIIKVQGSASAKVGSKALFDSTGKNLWGWVGGGCAETFVSNNAVQSIEKQESRIVQADLDDEVHGLGVPCGGVMDVYIEPLLPKETVEISAASKNFQQLEFLLKQMNFEPLAAESTPNQDSANSLASGNNNNEPSATGGSHETLLLELAQNIAQSRSLSFEHLRTVKGYGSFSLNPKDFSRVLILGNSRITEELAQFLSILKWPFEIYGPLLANENYPRGSAITCDWANYQNVEFQKDDFVIVASHHPTDGELIANALKAGASYVGLIGSKKRVDSLNLKNGDTLFAPAGINLGCKNPSEIALSLVAEMILLRTHS